MRRSGVGIPFARCRRDACRCVSRRRAEGPQHARGGQCDRRQPKRRQTGMKGEHDWGPGNYRRDGAPDAAPIQREIELKTKRSLVNKSRLGLSR